jgi:hypothetical protein
MARRSVVSERPLLERARSPVELDGARRRDPAADRGNFMAALRKDALIARRSTCAKRPRVWWTGMWRGYSWGRDVPRVYEALALIRMGLNSFRKAPIVYARRG